MQFQFFRSDYILSSQQNFPQHPLRTSMHYIHSTLEHPVAILQALQWVPLLMLPCRLCKTSLSVNCTFNHFMCFNTRASQILLANLKDLDRTLRALGTLIGEGALKLFVFCHRGCEHITHNQPSLAIVSLRT